MLTNTRIRMLAAAWILVQAFILVDVVIRVMHPID